MRRLIRTGALCMRGPGPAPNCPTPVLQPAADDGFWDGAAASPTPWSGATPGGSRPPRRRSTTGRPAAPAASQRKPLVPRARRRRLRPPAAASSMPRAASGGRCCWSPRRSPAWRAAWPPAAAAPCSSIRAPGSRWSRRPRRRWPRWSLRPPSSRPLGPAPAPCRPGLGLRPTAPPGGPRPGGSKAWFLPRRWATCRPARSCAARRRRRRPRR